MLNSYISSTRGDASRRILEFYQRHYHAHAVLVAKARFGLYALCRSLFKPGSEIIISPVTCHTVIEALLAAGVLPRFVEIDLMTGNIDVSRLDPGLLGRGSGLITTNLYGNPDRIVELKAICEQHGLALIEDCAHVLRSLVDGREVGSFGIASVFSFGKHLGENGGAVVTSDPRLAAAVEQVVRHEAVVPGLRDDALRLVQHRLSGVMPRPAMRTLAALVRPLRGGGAATAGTASPVEPVSAASQSAARGTARMPNAASLCRVADALGRRDQIAAKRMAQTAEFVRACPLPMRLTGREGDNCLLAIPVIHDGRKDVIRQVSEKGVPTYFLYNPPMNEAYAGRIAGPPETGLVTPRQWCSNILPVNPRHGGLYLDAIRSTSMHACA